MADDTQGIGDLVAQGSQPSTGAVDTSAATPQTPSQTPPTGPQPSTAPPTPAPQGTGAPAGAPQEQPNPNQPDAQKAPQQPSQPQKPAASATDPAVEKASKVHTILQALTGGPHFATTVNPNTGTVERTQVPMSNAQFARGLAAAVLTGAFSGLEEKGPGAEGRAAAAGFNATLNQAKQQQAQEEREASETYGRQAAIANTNFQMHQTAQRMGQLDYEQHKQFVGDSADALKSINDVGASLATNVREEDLLPKYNITAVNAIPDGITKRLNADGSQATDKYGQPLWDNTYTVIDPAKKIGLDQNTADFLAQHHVPGYFTMVDGKTVPKDFTGSPQVRAGIVVAGIAQASAIRTTEAQLNQQLAKLPKEGTQDAKVFEANLTKELEDGSVSPKALQAFAPYASMPFDQALDAMRKNKLDPQVIGQITNLVPQDAQEAMKKGRLDQEASDKSAREAAAAVDKQKAELPGQVAEATAKAKINLTYAGQEAYNRAFNEAKGKAAGEVASGVGGKGDVDAKAFFADDPVLGALITPTNLAPDGINHKFLDAFTKKNPELGNLVMQILSGKNATGLYGLAKGRGQMLDAAVAATSSEYSKPDAVQYQKTKLDFGPSGKAGKALQSGGTAFTHLANLNDAVDKFTTGAFPGFKTVGDWLDSDKSGQYATGIANVPQELGVLYAGGGAPHEGDVKSYRDAYHGPPDKVKAAIKQQAINAMDKMETTAEAYYAGVPSTFVKPPTFLSDRDAANYTKVTGLPVDPKLLQHSHVIGDTSGSGATNLNGIKDINNKGQAARAPYPGQRPDEVPVFDPNDPNKLLGFTKPGKTGYRPVQQ